MRNSHPPESPAHINNADIWLFDRGRYKVYVEDRALKDQIAGWRGCTVHGVYFNQRFQVVGWDLLMSSRLYDRVAKLCGLPPRAKSPRRVAQGQRVGALAQARNHLGLPQEGSFSNSQFQPAGHQ